MLVDAAPRAADGAVRCPGLDGNRLRKSVLDYMTRDRDLHGDASKASAASGFWGADGAFPLIRRLVLENFSRYAARYALAMVFMVLVAASTALSAWIMRDVVESLFISRDFEKIVYVAGFVVAIFLVKGMATYGQTVTLSRVGNAIVAAIQMRLYDRILNQGGDFHIRYPSNDLVTRIGSNAQSARTVIDLLVVSLGRDILTLIGLVLVMLAQDWLLTLIALFIAPPIVFLVASLVQRVRKVAKQLFVSSTLIVSAMQDTVAGIKIVKSFAMEDAMKRRMAAAVEDVRVRNDKIAALSARTSPVMETFGGICIALMILYAGWQVSTSSRTPADFMAFLTALLLAYEPAKRIARLHIGLEAGLVGVRLMYEILDEPLTIKDADGAKPLAVTKGEIVFRDVDFSYPGGEDAGLRVLRAVTMVAEGGKTTALVGPSGSGKTTIINLIQRFYDIDGGAIAIDGQDIRSVALRSLRHAIAFVSQDTFLFAGSVGANILAGKPDASFEEVREAARAANADGFIMALEKGYGTELGENGAGLSGGQRQRIAIARAILKDAPVVLLDEATSALDAESEHLIHEAFDRLKVGRTTLVIAHRLSTVRDADCIHVIENGRCVESGDHAGLMAKGRLYRNLHDLQFKGRDRQAMG